MPDHQNLLSNKLLTDIKYVLFAMNIIGLNPNAEYVDVRLAKKANF